jgi:hypothetical protein
MCVTLHLEGCDGCEHRAGRFCGAVDLGRVPPTAWRRRGTLLVPTWCPLGELPWPEDERAIAPCPCGEACRLELPDGSCAAARAEDGPMSQEAVGALLGVTKQTIAHIEARALRRLGPRLAHLND